MKILVLGASGYIGSVLVEKLLNWSSNVEKLTAVDNLMYNQCVNSSAYSDERFIFIRQDVTDLEIMKPLYDDAEIIINLACLTGMDICEQNKKLAWLVNYQVVEAMCDYLRASGQEDKTIVSPCSSSSYGIQPKNVWATEEMPTFPISTYAKTKVEAEKVILSFGGTSLRFCTCFGIGNGFHRVGLLVNTFTFDGHKKGIINLFESSFMRSYLWVNDAAEAILLAISHYDTAKGKVYNVGDNNAVLSKGDLAELVAKYTDCRIIEVNNKEDTDKRSYSVDSSLIARELGFKPQRSIEQVVQDLIKFYAAVDERSANIYFIRT
jgi:nucleoside-diphosphate-sugar epimerase